ncbi:ABC transporter ATP-binding protein [Bacillus atrophaeus]|uniref:ABC transporter ATP-binding protein n=1 Tax=Bacillus atrophaeus TaxID=1452 RepID=UPI000D03C890|nr:ABC transporter ATP-binding protein [Bacillus atrophaeus]MDS9996237.1 ABC transporter ATP-binding protein [Bacillus atrophaeus]PRS08341.1 ABC transporter ATP-binding protein [Bacillus atrophaeus]QUF64639.1 ABC transporter ATP-binding protein [Bacillus atrophaeus]
MKNSVPITVQHLFKSYDDHQVIKGISFDLKKGEVFGLLGPNGAGKTTILESIIGLRKPSSGEISVMGCNPLKQPEKIRSFIGVQPQETNLFPYLKVGETLKLFSSLYKKSRPPEEILRLVGLEEMMNKPIRKLSGGQRKRLLISISLISDPDILFLDEPTASLDPHSRRQIWDIIQSLKEKGKSVFLTTHSMEEAYTQCDRTAILYNGKFAALGTPADLIQTYCPQQRLFLKYAGQKRVEQIKSIPEIKESSIKTLPAGYELEIVAEPITKNVISSVMKQIDADWSSIRIEQGTLEDVFLKLTGKKIREGVLV